MKGARLFPALLVAAAVLGFLPRAAVGLDTATYSTGWVPLPRDMGFFVARDKGWYRAAGLDIKLIRGYGGGAVAKDLAAGTIEFGHADPRSVILIRSQGGDLRTIGVIHAESVFTIFALKGSGIAKPKDLEGRTVGAAPGEAAFVNLPVLAAVNRVDFAKIRHVPLQPPASIPSLVAGKVDAITLFTISLPIVQQVAAKQGKEVVSIPYSEHGLDIYSIGVATRDRVIREKRSLVQRFIQDSMKGTAWAVEHSDEALEIFHKSVPAAGREVSREGWKITVKHLLTPEAKEHGIGYMTREKWERTLGAVRKTTPEDLSRVAVTDLYTNEFLPRLIPKAP
ncbi:MAG: ABC transporter substrate-binding protein [Candidatus Tectomicrobia bacterium]|nr:ABC transporter substrate-binding protein [Candidatus Tectomicrobia bacterium]